MDILSPQKISELINELFGITRSYGQKMTLDLIVWVSVWLSLLWMVHEDSERQAIAEFNDEEYPPLFSDRKFFNVLFEYDLPLRSMEHETLVRELNKTDNNPLRPIARQIYFDKNVQNIVSKFIGIDDMFKWLDKWFFEIDFSKPSYVRRASTFLESLIVEVMKKQRATEYFTPKSVVDLMVELADPKPGERIYDPCFGTGGLLVESARRIKTAVKTLPAGEWDRLRSRSIFGVDMNPLVYTIALTRIILAGIPEPNLELADSLERPGASPADSFDVILACPPWGYLGQVSNRDQSRYRHFPLPSKDLTNLFLQHIMQSLRPEGRAVVAVPEGTLFSAGPDLKLRQRLLKDFSVEGIISLPAGTFAPFTGIKSNVLLFQKSKPKKDIRFLEVQRLAGTGGKASHKEEKPFEITQLFREGKSSEKLWDKPVTELKKRDWELIAKRGGDEELTKWLDALKEADPEIKEVPLSKVSEVISGVSYGRKTTTTDIIPSKGMPIVRISDIKENRIMQPDLFLNEKSQSKVKPTQVLKADDILVSTSGTIGKMGLVIADDNIEECAVAKSLVLIRSWESILPEYLLALLHSETYQKWMTGRARGSTIQHLSIRTLRHLPIPVPALPLQERLIKEWRAKRDTNVLSILLEIASRKDDHEFEAFIGLVNAVGRVVSDLSDFSESDSLIVLGKLADRCESFCNEFEKRSHLDGWKDWFKHLSNACDNLKDIQRIPKGPTLFALLQTALPSFANANDFLREFFEDIEDNDFLKIQGRLNSISDIGTRLIQKALATLLGDIHIEALIREELMSVGVQNEFQVDIMNKGALPLRDFDLESRPDIGSANVTYFAESSIKPIVFRIPPQVIPGKFDFSLSWHARNMKGEMVNGQIELAVDFKPIREALYQTSLGPSPYITGSPVDREEMFFGRKDIIEKIRLQLSTSHRANVILLEGNRRSGKTSILNRIVSDSLFPEWIPAYCTFQRATGHSQKAGVPTEQIFKTMSIEIFKAAIEAGIRTWFPHLDMPHKSGFALEADFSKTAIHVFRTEDAVDAFDFYLRAVLDAIAPKRLLLILDEFDKIQDGIDTGITSPQVPENIRALLHAYSNMTAILSYSKLLRRLRQEYWSVLFGLGHPVDVGSLDMENARLLVTQPAEGRLIFTDAAKDKIVKLCAQQPYLIQKLCNRIFEMATEKAQRTVSEQIVDKASELMVADDEHFATLWQHHVGSDRRRFILTLCERLSGSPDPIKRKLIEIKLEEAGIAIRRQQDLSDDLMHLRELEMLTMDDSGVAYRLSVPLMGAWIRQNVDYEDQRRCAVEESEEQL